MHSQVPGGGIAELGRNTIRSVGFRRGQGGTTAGRNIEAIPPIAGKLEGGRSGVAAHVDAAGRPLGGLEDHEVVGERSFATRSESGGGVFLKYPDHPTFRDINRVEADNGVGNPDKCDGSCAAEEGVALDAQFLGFPMNLPIDERRSEEFQAGAAAKIHAARSGVLESIPPNDDGTAPSFGLDTIGAPVGGRWQMSENVAFNQSPMTADQVDAGSSRAPALDRATFDAEVSDTGKLDAIAIAGGSYVSDSEATQHQMSGGCFARSAVVDVQPVSRGAGEHEILEFHSFWSGKLDPVGAALNYGRIKGISGSDDNGGSLLTSELREGEAAGVGSWGEEDTGAGSSGIDGFPQGGSGVDRKGCRMVLSGEKEGRRGRVWKFQVQEAIDHRSRGRERRPLIQSQIGGMEQVDSVGLSGG